MVQAPARFVASYSVAVSDSTRRCRRWLLLKGVTFSIFSRRQRKKIWHLTHYPRRDTDTSVRCWLRCWGTAVRQYHLSCGGTTVLGGVGCTCLCLCRCLCRCRARQQPV